VRLLLAVLAVLASGRAQAQAPVEDPTVLYQDGRAAYERKDCQGALDKFNRSFALSHRPGLLYNIARALDCLQRLDEAAEAYRSYLRVQPDDPDRSAIEAQIRALDEARRQHALTAAPITAPARPARPVYKRWWFWTTIGGVAVVGLAVGLGVGLSNSNSLSASTTAGTFRF
jgi:tetratricopeptide (TPR) repeat protein